MECEVEAFEVTEDDLVPGYGRKKRRKMTKEDHIYGMWAPRHDDSDDEGASRKKDYTRPVNFVSSQRGEGEGEDSGDGDDSDAEGDYDAEVDRILEQREQRKLDKGGEKVGIGKFRHASLQKNKTLFSVSQEQTKSSTAGSVPRASGSRAVSHGMTSSTQHQQSQDKDFGRWERFTGGFGSKMLSKMGWRPDTGLGKEGEGIVNPVKASRHTEFGKGLAHMQINRPSGGVGVVSDAVDEEDAEDQRRFQEQLQQWRKLEGAGSVKPKYVYKTVDDLKQSGKVYQKSSSKSGKGMKVIDMTGRQQRVLGSYEEIHDRHSRPGDSLTSEEGTNKRLYLQELYHNVELLVSSSEQDILRSERLLHYNQDLVVTLKHEGEGLGKQVQAEEEEIRKLTEVLSTIEMCEDRLLSDDSAPLSLVECREVLCSLQESFPEQYRAYHLSSLAVALVFPLVKQHLEEWDVLSDPGYPVEVFTSWRAVLAETDNTASTDQHNTTIPSSDNMNPYDRLVWEVWMPKLRRALSSWSPRQCHLVIDLLGVWSSLLPGWVLENVLEQLLLPRLQAEVEAWDPTSDVLPIHCWVHPWLTLMGRRLEVVYAPIRYKFGMALNNWVPSDSSAHKILQPWAQVFPSQVMEAFLVRTILPKLAYCLQNMVVNPHHQDIAPFEWVLAWTDMLPAHHYGNLLDKHFFPRWLQVLDSWLRNNPNFEEVRKWYLGWKNMLDSRILAQHVVKGSLNQALDMMNRAVAGTYQPGARENMAYFTSTERRRGAEPGTLDLQTVSSLHNAVSAPASVSLKDVLEKMAEDLGVLFMPVAGQRRHEGKALYKFGQTTMYIDRGVVFAAKPSGQWGPVSLDELRSLA